MNEPDLAAAPPLDDVIRLVAAPLVSPGESIAVNLEGERTFIRRIDIPAAAQKQLAEVLPYELESELPFELADAIYDHATLRRAGDAADLPVLPGVPRTAPSRPPLALI